MDSQTKTELFHMYQSYKRELWTYTGQNFEDELKNWFEDIITMLKPIRDAHTNTLIGFFVVQELDHEQQTKSECKWYISEAYIIPSRRGQRFMTSIVYEFIARNKGNIGLVVNKNNVKAMKFWDDILGSHGFIKERIYELGNDIDYFYKFTEPKIR